MVRDDDSSSGGDTDQSSNGLNWGDKDFSEQGSLEKEWEAIELNLYQENNTNVELKPIILQECRMWRDTFPFLRVKGQRIENPLALKRQIAKKEILNLVVDQIIYKLNGGVVDITEEMSGSPNKEESYFERGKLRDKPSHLEERIRTQQTVGSSTSTSSALPVDTKVQPKGILKHRRKAIKKAHEPKSYKESASQTFRSSSLPRISTKNNNWLNRSEKTSQRIESNRQIPREKRKPCSCRSQNSQFILPPIKTPTDFNKI